MNYLLLTQLACTNEKSNNTLLEKYILHNTLISNKKGYFSNPKYNNLLAVKLLESKLQFKHRQNGLHRLLGIVKSDLIDMINSPLLDIKIAGSNTLSRVTGINRFTKNVSNLINDIIEIINILLKTTAPIDLVDDLENPIIKSIHKNLMGGSENGFKNAKELLKQILIFVLYKFASPWGLQGHEKIIISDEINQALYDIIKFYLYNSIFGYSSNFITKRILNISEIVLNISTDLLKDNNKHLEDFINSYIQEINKDIENKFRCSRKNNGNKTGCNNIFKLIKKCNVCKECKKCSMNNFNSCKKICNNKKCFNNNLSKIGRCNDSDFHFSIIRQAQKGSILATLIIHSEYFLLDNTSLNLQDLLGYKTEEKSFFSSLTNTAFSYIQKRAIENYEQLNNILILVEKGGGSSYINNAMITWGLVPPCDNTISIINYKKQSSLINQNSNYTFNEVCYQYCRNMSQTISLNRDKYKGLLKPYKNNTHLYYADLYGLEKKYNNKNPTTYYFSSYNINSFTFTPEDKISKNILAPFSFNNNLNLYDKLSAIINQTYISYSHFKESTYRNANVYVTILNSKIYFNNVNYIVSLIFNYNDIKQYLKQQNDLYILKSDQHQKFIDLFNNVLLRNDSIKLSLIPENILGSDLKETDFAPRENKRFFGKTTYEYMKKKIISSKKFNTYKKISLIVSINNDMDKLVVPRDNLFSPNEIEYIVFKKKYSGGSKNNNLSHKNISQLKQLCKIKNIKGYSKLNKNQLLQILNH